MKRVGSVVLVAVFLAGAGLLGAWMHGQYGRTVQAATPEVGAGRVITVVGQGSARVAPDIAQVSVGVDTVADTVSEAVLESNSRMGAILPALKSLGVADKDIQTQNYSISVEQGSVTQGPEGTATQGKPRYRVTNMVNVTIRDLGKVGNVLDAVVEAGANNIWGVSFSVDDTKAALTEARGKAVADAQARARELAGLAGVELGSIVSVSEVVGNNSYPVAVERAFGMGADTSVSVGEVEVSYQVQAVYSLEP
ncbi:MAG TPA: SIMPL domain-containing protein [Anaerolineae bacterium]|nr:SIMPL domain-containing protein [Anaerolineae bacterium]